MRIKKMDSESVNQVAELYIKLVDFMKEESEDEYFNYDSISAEHFTEWLNSTLDDDNQVTYIAQDKEVVAFISGEMKECFLPISDIEEVGYIKGAYVVRDYRKQGIMKTLEEKVVDFFNNKGISFVELNVISNNFLGKNAWKSLGYSTFREQMRKEI